MPKNQNHYEDTGQINQKITEIINEIREAHEKFSKEVKSNFDGITPLKRELRNYISLKVYEIHGEN